MERNSTIDALKGCGIILMVIGHSLLPSILARPFLIFHMPLFFIVSGYLFKEKPIVEVIKKNFKRVIVPYFFTGCIMWLCLALLNEQYDWGISLLFGNAYKTLCWDMSYTVGPLWFLISFFFAAIFFSLVKKIPQKWLQITILLILFYISLWIKDVVNMLPLGLLPAIPGALFFFLGNTLREYKAKLVNKGTMFGGMICYLICCLYGQLAMSWHIYKLHLVQIVAAFFSTIILYQMLKKMKYKSFLSYVGIYSLPLMCIHSIDRHLGITLSIVEKLNINNLPINVVLDISLKAVFIIVLFAVVKKISIFKLVYAIK